ncbi:MAG TPA: iron-containing redox enzyme family protein [Trebonia sp.]|nr:iron-containing redox enzyme family protein [Trebonia sp.]
MFELPDTIAALPRLGFEVSAQAAGEADAIIAAGPVALFERLLGDQESEAVHLVARRVLGAFLTEHAASPPGWPPVDCGADGIAEHVRVARNDLTTTIGTLRGAGPDARDAVRRQRAPLALLGGCWLDVLSQPATQPSVIVNRLFTQHYALRGEGNPRRSQSYLRRRELEEAGIYLPEIGAAEFAAQAITRPLTALHACCYLSLSRLPANFLPELIGVHYAVLALGVDDQLAGRAPMLPESELREVLAAYLALAGPAERERLHTGLRLGLGLEREQVAMLAELAEWHQNRSLESKVAAIVARHAPYAGSHHRQVRVGGRLLTDAFRDPGLDIAAFLADFRDSAWLRRGGDGLAAFSQAIKLGGPMFGIFDEGEAATFQAWIATVQAGQRPDIVISPLAVGDARARQWMAMITGSAPADIVIAAPGSPDDRELFYRLVNIENYPNARPIAAERAERVFQQSEILFTHGGDGRYTDASYFDYSPDALLRRASQVYWQKLVDPYQPLEELPSRDVVVFLQATYALGALVDAAWIHRVANTGRYERACDGALLAIYADEVGYGDLRKNHITLIHQALRSMDIRLPHIRDAAFKGQDDLPDDLYGFSLHQLCMALHPDTYFNEILGYNLAIEMFGLGELRLHEIQKLRHYGFDDGYEQAHLTIDNLSAGHSRQAVDIIVSYLDEVRRTLGDAATQREWRRVWRGYASLAYFVEHALVKRLAAEPEAETVDLLL